LRQEDQPASVTNGANSDVSFSVIVRGESPLHYQWQFNGKKLVDNIHVGGTGGTNLKTMAVVARVHS